MKEAIVGTYDTHTRLSVLELAHALLNQSIDASTELTPLIIADVREDERKRTVYVIAQERKEAS